MLRAITAALKVGRMNHACFLLNPPPLATVLLSYRKGK